MSELIAWTDIQTNGLPLFNWMSPYPDCAELLEVGVFITDAEAPFKLRGAVNQVVQPVDLAPEEIFATMPDDVYEMHEKSGLNDHFRNVKAIMNVKDAEQDVIEMFSRKGEPGDFVMAGRGLSVVGGWLAQCMPELYSWYNEQWLMEIDLSHLSRVMRYAEVPEPEFDDDLSHRAVHDAQRHCEEFLYYVDRIRSDHQPTTTAYLR